MLGQVFKRPQRGRVFRETVFREFDELGLKSIGIVIFISFFIGGVIALQTALNIENPLIPKYLVGFATKRSVILEFAPTFCSIILAGKVGSYITSSIGSMRVTEQIDSRRSATIVMQEDAQNLTKALKGDVQQQGAWGEQVLETALEKAGLQENISYYLQPTYKDRKGNNLRPDAVIMLPNERNIVIDSKVSLTAYERFVNAEEETEKQSYLKDHIDSIKKHIKVLSSKNYNDLEDLNAPDYLFIFVPIDSALSVALINDWNLQTLANDNKIAFVTPINLIAILRIAENLWRLDSQNKHAEDIASRAGLLFDKFSNLSKDLSEVGRHIDKVQESYNSAISKLSEGDGNLFTHVNKLKDLGAKTQKELSKPKKSINDD